MKNFLKISLLVVAVSSFSACKKCYECVKQEYCFTAEVNAFGTPTTIPSACYNTSEERETAISSARSQFQAIGTFTVTSRTQNAITGVSEEVCGKSSEVDDETKTLETAGYACEEQ